jgi:hypothetical protein
MPQYENGKMYSNHQVFKNPQTGEYASKFIHGIKVTIVTHDMTISCNENKAHKTLQQMGFIEEIFPTEMRY